MDEFRIKKIELNYKYFQKELFKLLTGRCIEWDNNGNVDLGLITCPNKMGLAN